MRLRLRLAPSLWSLLRSLPPSFVLRLFSSLLYSPNNIMGEIARSLGVIQKKIQACASGRNVRLVAVSKTKPIEDLMEAYNAGQRHFGENYVRLSDFQCAII